MTSSSLYRTYRPQTFSAVRGQQHLTTALLNAVREDRVGHAYLFSGPRGTGKTTTARLLAKALNCLNPGEDGQPCGECDNCTSIAAGTFPDLFELDAASNNGVDAMRDLVEKVHLGLSASGKRKVYVVDEVHMLSAAAANALLKTLEEPPGHVVFILATTDPQKVLPTIRSRTQHFELNLISADELREVLTEILAQEGITAEPAAIDMVVRRSGGSARDALSIMEQVLAIGVDHGGHSIDTARVLAAFGGTGFDRRVAVLDAIASDQPADALIAAQEALARGIEPRELAEELLATARDAFVESAAAGRVPYDGPEHERTRLAELGAAAGVGRLTRVIETLGDAIADMRANGAPDPRLVLEVAVVKLARREAGSSLEELRERIERLEAQPRAASGTRAAAPAVPAAAAADEPEPATERVVAAPPPPRAASPRAPMPRASEPAAASSAPMALGAVPRRSAAPPPAPEPVAAPAAPTASGPLDFDDVVVAWKDTLEALNPATRSMVAHVQPVDVEGDVIVFGAPTDQLVAVKQRFKGRADEIRAELQRLLNRAVRFNIVAHDFNAPDALRPRTAPAVGGPSYDEPPIGEPPEDDAVDLSGLVDAPDVPVIDETSLLTEALGATVVEEKPREG